MLLSESVFNIWLAASSMAMVGLSGEAREEENVKESKSGDQRG